MGWRPFRRKRPNPSGQMIKAVGGYAAPAPGAVFGQTGATGPAYIGGFSSMTAASIPLSVVSGPAPPFSVADLGTAIEPIVALRSYYIDIDMADDPMLCSYNGVVWPHRRALYAYCSNDLFAEHDAPHENCQCGIYAWRKELTGNVTGQLYGEVYLWGDVLICDQGGYRAEIAYPKSLILKGLPTRALMRIRDGLESGYGVPVKIDHPDAKRLVGDNAFTTWDDHFNNSMEKAS